MIYKTSIILGVPLLIGAFATKYSGQFWFMPVVYLTTGILYIVFRQKLASVFYEEDKKAKEMSKNVSWKTLKNMTFDSPIDKNVKDDYVKGAIQFGKWYIIIALILVLCYYIMVK